MKGCKTEKESNCAFCGRWNHLSKSCKWSNTPEISCVYPVHLEYLGCLSPDLSMAH